MGEIGEVNVVGLVCGSPNGGEDEENCGFGGQYSGVVGFERSCRVRRKVVPFEAGVKEGEE